MTEPFAEFLDYQRRLLVRVAALAAARQLPFDPHRFAQAYAEWSEDRWAAGWLNDTMVEDDTLLHLLQEHGAWTLDDVRWLLGQVALWCDNHHRSDLAAASRTLAERLEEDA